VISPVEFRFTRQTHKACRRGAARRQVTRGVQADGWQQHAHAAGGALPGHQIVAGRREAGLPRLRGKVERRLQRRARRRHNHQHFIGGGVLHWRRAGKSHLHVHARPCAPLYVSSHACRDPALADSMHAMRSQADRRHAG